MSNKNSKKSKFYFIDVFGKLYFLILIINDRKSLFFFKKISNLMIWFTGTFIILDVP